MSRTLALGLGLTVASAATINWAYLREHDAAAALPMLSLRRPLHSLWLLVGDRTWLSGFVAETGGFLLYVAALRFAPLALVQAVSAGGIGVLAFLSARMAGRPALARERTGVGLAVLGLAALGASLGGAAPSTDTGGSATAVGLWLAGSLVVAGVALRAGRRRFGDAAAYGAAAGVLFAAGDLSTKTAIAGGARLAFFVAVVAFYLAGTSVLQIAYQHGAALATAGLATLLTSALPIIAGTTILGEGLPHGIFAGLRLGGFVAVVAGAVTLTRPERPPMPLDEGMPAAVAP